jgi:transposase
MANKLITMLKSKSILQMLINGKSKAHIAQECNLSLNTVKKYIKQFQASGLSYVELLAKERDEYIKLVYPDREPPLMPQKLKALTELLPDYVNRLTTTHSNRQILWDEYREKYPQGYSYSQFCEHISQFLKQSKVVMPLIHKPGDVLQIDFAGDKLQYIDRATNDIIHCPVLVCSLPFSGFCYVEALPDMSLLSLIGALNRCMAYLQGVPANICSDNLKQVVTKSDRHEPTFTELMLQFALYYGTSLTATRVVKPRDKASVERHVSISYTSIYAYMERQAYYSLSELNLGIKKYLEALNNKPMQKKSVSRCSLFLEYEAPLLKPLPATPFEVKYRTSAKVSATYHISLGKDWHNYSVPYQYVGKRVSIEYDRENVEIYYNMKLIALHKRNYTRNGYTTVPDHCPENHKIAMILQQITPEELILKAGEIGNHTQQYIKGILDKQFFSHQILKSCLGVIALAKNYGNQRVECACELALKGMEFNLKTIRNILKNGTDMITQENTIEPVTQNYHENIRGADFFFKLFCN